MSSALIPSLACETMCSLCRSFKIYYAHPHEQTNCPYTRSCYCSYCAKTGHTTDQCQHRICKTQTALRIAPIVEDISYPFTVEVTDDKKTIDSFLLAYGETNAGNYEKSKQKLVDLFKNKELVKAMYKMDNIQLIFLDPVTGEEKKASVDGEKVKSKVKKPKGIKT